MAGKSLSQDNVSKGEIYLWAGMEVEILETEASKVRISFHSVSSGLKVAFARYDELRSIPTASAVGGNRS